MTHLKRRLGRTTPRFQLRIKRDRMEAKSEAEFYLATGNVVVHFVRGGAPLDVVARRFNQPVSDCWLYMRYAESSDSFKLRALVEEWPWEKIKQQLG